MMHQARSTANRRARGQHKIVKAMTTIARIVGIAPTELIAAARPVDSPATRAIS